MHLSLRVSPCSETLAFLGTLVLDTVPPHLLLVSKVAKHALLQPAGSVGNPQTAVQLLFAFSKQRAHPVPNCDCMHQRSYCFQPCCHYLLRDGRYRVACM